MPSVHMIEAAKAQLGKIVYADWAGAALQLEVNAESSFIEPPHSNPALFSESRSAISLFLGDYGDDYSVVFTSGATAAFELISRHLPWRKGTGERNLTGARYPLECAEEAKRKGVADLRTQGYRSCLHSEACSLCADNTA